MSVFWVISIIYFSWKIFFLFIRSFYEILKEVWWHLSCMISGLMFPKGLATKKNWEQCGGNVYWNVWKTSTKNMWYLLTHLRDYIFQNFPLNILTDCKRFQLLTSMEDIFKQKWDCESQWPMLMIISFLFQLICLPTPCHHFWATFQAIFPIYTLTFILLMEVHT